MTPRQPLACMLAVLCVFAVIGAQLFGVARGFVCDCGGRSQVVEVSSCSGSHGEHCHMEESESGTHDEEGNENRKEHEQVKDDLTGTNGQAPHVVIPAPVMCAALPALMFFAPECLPAPREYPPDSYGGPPPGIAVARTVVLRI